VARRKAREWGLPRKLQAAYVYPRNAQERAFLDDHAALEAATREWLAVAHALLAERAFPPTPDGDDCAFCPFRVTCDGAERAATAVDEAAGAVEAFFALKVEPEEEP
jgi:hypothetical protein